MEFVILVYSWSYLYGFVQNSLQYLYPRCLVQNRGGARREKNKKSFEIDLFLYSYNILCYFIKKIVGFKLF